MFPLLSLVFLDELLAMAALGVAGWHAGGGSRLLSWLLVVLLPLAAAAVWGLFASPRAPLGGPVLRLLVKVLVFAAGCLGLWLAGHPGWAAALLVFSVAVNGLARLRAVRAVTE